MGFNFTKFTQVNDSFAARVSIRQRTGQIGFNSGACNAFGITDHEYVILYYDEAQRAIGLTLEKEKSDGCIEIKSSKSNTYIRAKNFLDRFQIDYSASRRFELRKERDSGFLYFLIDQPILNEEDPENGDESTAGED